MSDHKMAQQQIHTHGVGCGHPTIGHQDHRDYMNRGRLDHVKGRHVEAHSLAVDRTNPAVCTPSHHCGEHSADHAHGPRCGHHAVPHGDHVDYVVSGHLHHPCSDHCDDHGQVKIEA